MEKQERRGTGRDRQRNGGGGGGVLGAIQGRIEG
jgi:hypothetical protein